MNYNFEEYGELTIENTVNVKLTCPVATLLMHFPAGASLLSPEARMRIMEAESTQDPVEISEDAQRSLNAMAMSICSEIMKSKMDKMWICGAAKFIPPRK